jgi:hypothetical protein
MEVVFAADSMDLSLASIPAEFDRTNLWKAADGWIEV